MQKLVVTSPSFSTGGLIPVENTGYGQDLSPALALSSLAPGALSLAVIMDDLGLPVPAYNHWLIWNLPPRREIPAAIPHGETVPALGGAVQGVGYGRHRYRGPKPPFNWSHEYRFTVYVLDTMLTLPPSARKKSLLAAMEGHILQQGSITGHYR